MTFLCHTILLGVANTKSSMLTLLLPLVFSNSISSLATVIIVYIYYPLVAMLGFYQNNYFFSAKIRILNLDQIQCRSLKPSNTCDTNRSNILQIAKSNGMKSQVTLMTHVQRSEMAQSSSITYELYSMRAKPYHKTLKCPLSVIFKSRL